jgi:hypothetical protein
MISNTKQNWIPGKIVKVGFLSLKVLRAEAIKDYLPDIYYLSNLDGSRFYQFIPHNGLTRIETTSNLICAYKLTR